MAQRYSTEEVIEFLLDDDNDDFDDPNEIILEGSDEEFGDIDELNEVQLDQGKI